MTALTFAAHVVVGALIGASIWHAALIVATHRKDTQ